MREEQPDNPSGPPGANVTWQKTRIGKAERARSLAQWPMVIWLTGLSGAGKSTIASRLEQEIQAAGNHTYLLDGDNLRHGLNRDLGFSLEDRVENVRRVAAVAQVMVDAGLIVIAALISPLRSQREMARSLVPKGEFFEIFIDAPLDVCEARDPKGLYARARKGELQDFTGIDSPYEEPLDPELRIDTEKLTVDEAVAEILAYLGRNAPRQARSAAQSTSERTTHKRNDKFMISCTARSGSSMLSTLLNSHPRVLCHGEILAAPHESAGPYHELRKQGADVDDWLCEYRQERPEAFLYDVCFNPAGRQSVGFKFKLEESPASSYKSFRELLAADKDIRIIHLQRKNILDKYISLQTKQSGVFSIRSSDQRPDLRPFTIDIPDFIAYVRKDRQRYETAFEMFRDHPCLHLTYEELCESRPAALAKVQDFLELPRADLATMMVKVIKKNTDLVLNLDEVREALAAENAEAEMPS